MQIWLGGFAIRLQHLFVHLLPVVYASESYAKIAELAALAFCIFQLALHIRPVQPKEWNENEGWRGAAVWLGETLLKIRLKLIQLKLPPPGQQNGRQIQVVKWQRQMATSKRANNNGKCHNYGQSRPHKNMHIKCV